jgi:hypothetical protein
MLRHNILRNYGGSHLKKYILKAERLYESDRHFQAFENSYINLMGGGSHA